MLVTCIFPSSNNDTPQTKFEGYTGVTLSLGPSVRTLRDLVWGITSKVLKLVTSNFIGHIVEKGSVQET